jgi:perosamine synthetase
VCGFSGRVTASNILARAGGCVSFVADFDWPTGHAVAYPGYVIGLSRPRLGPEETEAVRRVLESGMLVQGAEVAAFEAAAANVIGRKHAIAVTNGTEALKLSLVALGVRPGDDVLCPNLTWPSPAHAIVDVGARPVLVEVDAAEWNVLPAQFAKARTGKTRAAIAIDQFGNPVRADEIAAALPGIPVLVDAACAIGSRYRGRACGSYGVLATISLHPRKVLTTGEGGLCLTDDDALAEHLRILRNHGQRAPGQFAQAAGNYRMGEMAAAIGRVQLTRLPAIIAERRELAARYQDALPELQAQCAPDSAELNHQTYGVLVPRGTSPSARDQVIDTLRARGIECGRLSYALHRLPHLAAFAQPNESYATSCDIVDRGMALPLFAGLSHSDQDRVVENLRAVLSL